MRRIDMEAMQNGAGAITVKLPMDVALYILNEKQVHLARLRVEWGLKVNIEIDTDLGHTELQIVRTVNADEVEFTPPARPEPVFDFGPDVADEEEIEDEEDEAAIEREDTDDDEASARAEPSEDRDDRRGGRRRRRRRGGRDRERPEAEPEQAADAADEDDGDEGEDEDDDFRRGGRGRRRRGRRGGRRAGFDSRPREPYAWVRARTPSLEAPYVWIDPFEEQQRRFVDGGRPARAETSIAALEAAPAVFDPSQAVESAVALVTAADAALGAASTQPTSLVPEELRDQPAPKRPRPQRKRRNAVSDATDAPAPEIVEAETIAEAPAEAVEAELPPVEVTPAPKKRATRSRKKADTAPVASAIEPEKAEFETLQPVIVAPEPVLAVARPLEPIVAEPDPNEIVAPPEKPKKGWWRR
jgi:ribonuclease E